MQLNFQWKLLWELEEFACTFGLQLLYKPQCSGGTNTNSMPFPAYQGCREPQKLLWREVSTTLCCPRWIQYFYCTQCQVFLFRIATFHLHSHHHKRHRKTHGLHPLWNITTNFIRSKDKKVWSCSEYKIQTMFSRSLDIHSNVMEKSRASQRTKKLRSHIASKNQIVLLLANSFSIFCSL